MHAAIVELFIRLCMAERDSQRQLSMDYILSTTSYISETNKVI